MNFQSKIIIHSLSLILFFISLYILLPAGMTKDSYFQLNEATVGIYSDGHPPIMAWFWRQLNHLHFGGSVIVIFQNLLFWSGLSLFITNLPGSLYSKVFSLLLIGLFPINLIQLGMVWKDSAMSASLVFALGMISSITPTKKNKSLYSALALLSLFYAVGVRHNGIFPVIPLAYWLVSKCDFLFFKSHKIIFSLILSTSLFVLVQVANNSLTKGQPKYYLEQATMFHDLLGISIRIDKLIIPDSFLNPEHGTTLMDLTKYYDPSQGFFMFKNNIYLHAPQNAPIEDIRSSWIKNILIHPIEYLGHRINFCKALINITNAGWFPWYYENDGTYTREQFKSFLEYLDSSLIRKGWIYLIINLLTLMWFYFKKPHNEHLKPCVYLTLSSLSLFLSNFIMAHSPDFRYLYWSIAATITSSTILLKHLTFRMSR